MVGDGGTSLPLSTGDFKSSEEESEDFLITVLLRVDALKGKLRPLVPGCPSCR